MAAAVLLAIAAGEWLWKASRPRVLTVCIFPDPTFRQRPNWRETLGARMAELSRIWEGEAGIRWQVMKVESDDPTGYLRGFETRRVEVQHDTPSTADVLLIVTGLREGNLRGAVMPFAHSALVVDAAGETEQANVRSFSRELTHLFAAPDDAKTPPISADGFSPRTKKLIRSLRDYPFARGAHGLDDTWDRRATDALTTAYTGVSPHPAAHAHLVLAMTLESESLNERAIPHLRSAVQADPGNAATRISLANLLAHNSQTEEAIAVLRQAAHDFPNRGEIYATLGLLLAHKDRGAASEAFRQGIQVDPKNAALYVGLGQVLLQSTGTLDEAVSIFQQALRLDPQSNAAQEGLLKALNGRAKMLAEVERYRKAAAASPGDAIAQYNYGVAEMNAGHREEAARAFSRAIALQPGMGRAHANLAVLRYMSHDFNAAWDEVGRARAGGAPVDSSFVAKLREKAPR